MPNIWPITVEVLFSVVSKLTETCVKNVPSLINLVSSSSRITPLT